MQLSRVMQSQGINDATLARLIGSRKCTVLEWKRNTHFPRADKLKLICKALKCSADELLGFTAPSKGLHRRYQDLHAAITKQGKYDSETMKEIAMSYYRRAGKHTELSLLFLEIADALYKMEIVTRENIQASNISIEQLSLFR